MRLVLLRKGYKKRYGIFFRVRFSGKVDSPRRFYLLSIRYTSYCY